MFVSFLFWVNYQVNVMLAGIDEEEKCCNVELQDVKIVLSRSYSQSCSVNSLLREEAEIHTGYLMGCLFNVVYFVSYMKSDSFLWLNDFAHPLGFPSF